MANYRKRIADDILDYKLKSLVKSKGMKEPKFLMVLTGTGSFAYDEDGVFVCPLSALKQ